MHDDLIKRLEAATADQQCELLIEAFDLLRPEHIDTAARARFILKLNAEAYESAALTLVPEVWYVHRLHQWIADNFTWSCDLAKKDMSLSLPVSAEDCPAPALAIVVAVLKSMSLK